MTYCLAKVNLKRFTTGAQLPLYSLLPAKNSSRSRTKRFRQDGFCTLNSERLHASVIIVLGTPDDNRNLLTRTGVERKTLPG